MLFNSHVFIFVFLPAALIGYWSLVRFESRGAGTGWLLAASIVFYAYASLESLGIIAPSILFDYAIARALLRTDASKHRLRSLLLVAGILANIALLGYFKYKNFFLDMANTLFITHIELTHVILPLGISFLTFQKIAFLCDVQSGQVKTIRFFDFLLFTLFFPRTVAGPIVHYQEVMPQLQDSTARNIMANVAVGVCLFSIGLFKKVVIGDGIGTFVSPAFDSSPSVPAPAFFTAWIGVLAYTFQLYFDFSGYSDMALGTARMFGVSLPMNFNSPFKASSILEFWSRWHMTLTRFLMAYLYTPIVMRLTRMRVSHKKSILCGKRSAPSALAMLVGLPTLITMTIAGLWHGAGWQFIVFGGLHGIFLSINQTWRILRPRYWPDRAGYERVMRPFGFMLTFGVVVFAFVFFRADSADAAFSILKSMAGVNGLWNHPTQQLLDLGLDPSWSLLWPQIAPLTWIVLLFLIVTLLPNSLELLRQYHPALDFPQGLQEGTASSVGALATARRSTIAKKHFVTERLSAIRAVIAHLTYKGVSLSALTATIVAVLCVFGIMGIGRSGAFLYWQF